VGCATNPTVHYWLHCLEIWGMIGTSQTTHTMQLQSLGANKTQVDLADGTSVFFSYKTPVAALVPGKGWIRTSTKYSSTTSRHINQWIAGTATEVDQWDIDQLVAF